MKRLVFLLLFLSACSGAVVVEEWPDGYTKETTEPVKKDFFVPEPIVETEFSVIEGTILTFVLNDENHTIELFEVTQERARMRIDNVSFMIGVNKTAIRSGVQITVAEVAQNSVPVPRRSAVDITVNGVRKQLFVDQTIDFGNVSASIEFIGLQDGEPHVMVVVNEQSAILSEKDEQRFDEFWVYVHNIYFNDATENDLADAITVSVK